MGNVDKDEKGCSLVRLEIGSKVVESVSGMTLTSMNTTGKVSIAANKEVFGVL